MSSLKIVFLNVGEGHGDSIIIESNGPAGRLVGIVDSCSLPGKLRPRALEYLTAQGVEQLSFVALTHPHADHYEGLDQIVEQYAGRIEYFYSYPIGSDKGRIEKLRVAYAKYALHGGSESVRKSALGFVKLLTMLPSSVETWNYVVGENSQLFPTGFAENGVDLFGMLPPAKVQGEYYAKLDAGILGDLSSPEANGLSFALELKFKGRTIVLGGDGTEQNWLARKRFGPPEVHASVVKIPHHGSRKDSSSRVVEYLFGEAVARLTDNPGHSPPFAVISANGIKHPHPDVLKDLSSRGIAPYCTSLAKICGGDKVITMSGDPTLDPVLVRLINTYGGGRQKISPCQGDITVSIDEQGNISVGTEHRRFCAYRPWEYGLSVGT